MSKELNSVARAALDYIDALPKDVVASLPAMPGFDRDWAENVLAGGVPSDVLEQVAPIDRRFMVDMSDVELPETELPVFTKEQLIAHLLERRAAIRPSVRQGDLMQAALMNRAVVDIALAALTAPAAGWTDAEELRSVEKDGCGYLFKANPVSPNADPRRVIKLYRLPEME